MMVFIYFVLNIMISYFFPDFLCLIRFPTIFFAPKNSKLTPKKYEGGREVDDFIKYIAKEASSPLKGFDKNGKPLKKKDTKQDL